MKVTIIGGGHIGSACAFGFLKSAATADITVTARTEKTLAQYQGTAIRTSFDNRFAVEGADIVILAVKTAQMPAVLEELKGLLDDCIVVSMAAQVSPELISEYAPYLAYAIPNVAAKFQESVTFLSDISAGKDKMKQVRTLFETLGLCVDVDIKMLPAGISLASCGIGYAIKYISSAVEGAMQLGFEHDEAAEIVCKTILGACLVAKDGGFNLSEELRRIATPGGLTEKGLNTMDKEGFTKAVVDGLKASI